MLVEPAKQRFVALEGRDQALVERSLETVPGLAERVEHADEGNLRVLALVALLPTRAWMLATASAATVSLGPAQLTPWLPPPLRLRGRDHRRPSAVDLDDQHLAVVVGHGCRVEKAARFRSDRVDHAQRRSRARRPLVKLGEEPAGVAKGQHCAELRDRRHGSQAEAAAQSQLAIDRQIRPATPAQTAS